jgi:hypothetical protein
VSSAFLYSDSSLWSECFNWTCSLIGVFGSGLTCLFPPKPATSQSAGFLALGKSRFRQFAVLSQPLIARLALGSFLVYP